MKKLRILPLKPKAFKLVMPDHHVAASDRQGDRYTKRNSFRDGRNSQSHRHQNHVEPSRAVWHFGILTVLGVPCDISRSHPRFNAWPKQEVTESKGPFFLQDLLAHVHTWAYIIRFANKPCIDGVVAFNKLHT